MSGNRELERDVKDSGSVCILLCFISTCSFLNSYALGGRILLMKLLFFTLEYGLPNYEFRIDIYQVTKR